MRSAGNEIREVRASGGFARSPLWRQMLADALGMDVQFPAGHEGSSFGAALLGMQALGIVDSVEVAADLVHISETVQPNPEDAAVYATLLPIFADLYQALVPTYTSLRRLANELPLEHESTDTSGPLVRRGLPSGPPPP
jgi:gluconokinase